MDIDQRSIYSPEAQILMLPLAFALLVPDFMIRNVINYHEALKVGKHKKEATVSKQDTLADFEQMLSKLNSTTTDVTKEEVESQVLPQRQENNKDNNSIKMHDEENVFSKSK